VLSFDPDQNVQEWKKLIQEKFQFKDVALLYLEDTLSSEYFYGGQTSQYIERTSNTTSVEFSNATPISTVLKDDFILQINKNVNYSVLSKIDIQDYFFMAAQRKHLEINSYSLRVFSNMLSLPEFKADCLAIYITCFIQQLMSTASPYVDHSFVQLVNQKILMDFSLRQKTNLNKIECLLQLLESKRDRMGLELKSIEEEL